jgi:hypothetical protein
LNNFYTDLKNSNDNLMSYQDKCNWVDAASKNTIDLEPDIYYFNFGGYSGKFIIDYNQNIHIMPSQFLNIAPIKHTGNIIDGFVITTPDGIKYSFGINTDAIEETHILSASYQTHRDNLDLNDYETSNLENIITKEIPYYRSGWHLSKIESPASDEIDLSYKANDIAYVTPQRTTLYYCPGASTYYYNGQTSKRDGYLYRYIFQLISQVDTTFIPRYTYGGVPDTQERVQAMSLTKAYIYTFSQSRYEIKQKNY